MTLSISQNNRLYPRFRLSYCAADSMANAAIDYLSISYTCQFYALSSPATTTTLKNCTIPLNVMSIGT